MSINDEILNELVDEFGTEILSSRHSHDGLTLRQCQILYNRYGMEQGIKIVQRWKSIYGKKAQNG